MLSKQRRWRAVPWAAILVSASVALGTVGAGAATHAATPATARARVTGPAATRYPPGTVVRLHHRLVRVTILNFAFRPARLVVSPGTKIIWTNQDGDPHTVASTNGAWSSEALDTTNQFARVFKKTGTVAYYCSIHPFMHGTIIVAK